MSYQLLKGSKRAPLIVAALAFFTVGCASEVPAPDTPQYGQLSAEELQVLEEISAQAQESFASSRPEPSWTPDNTAAYQDILRNTDIVYDEETASFINLEGAPASRELWQRSVEKRSELMDVGKTPSSSES